MTLLQGVCFKFSKLNYYLQCLYENLVTANTNLCSGTNFIFIYFTGTGVCNGDSGGGLAFETSGRWYIQGIVSVGPVKDGSCIRDQPAVFTQVSEHLDFIRKELNKLKN